MAEGRWRITVTAPDWGQDHLSSEAVVAFVDGELAAGPHHRATQHLGGCCECASQVRAQGQARSALRAARCPSLPSALLSSLRSIPQDTDLPAAPAGLAMTADGQLVSVLRPDRVAPPVPERPAPAPGAEHHVTSLPPAPDQRPSAARRRRLGTGVAVSGLALGALALGLPAAAPAAVAPAPAPDQRVLGGTPGIVDARLRLTPSSPGPSSAGPLSSAPSWIVPTRMVQPASTDRPEPGTNRGLR